MSIIGLRAAGMEGNTQNLWCLGAAAGCLRYPAGAWRLHCSKG
jgi:hypothetical protein